MWSGKTKTAERCTYYTKTAIGANHLAGGAPCQDHAASYHDEERTIVTACDGHGGALYIRSDRGSRFASAALIAALQQTDGSAFRRQKDEWADGLRIRIISTWNAMVERDLASDPVRRAETHALTDRQKETLRQDPFKAYGTTVHGAMMTENKLVCVSLGDGGVFLCRRDRIEQAFEEGDEQAANLTHSLCEEDAGRHMHVAVEDAGKWDGVLLGTDGAINPYGDLENLARSLALPAIRKLANKETDALAQFVTDLGRTAGTGDDVSLALLFREKRLHQYTSGR